MTMKVIITPADKASGPFPSWRIQGDNSDLSTEHVRFTILGMRAPEALFAGSVDYGSEGVGSGVASPEGSAGAGVSGAGGSLGASSGGGSSTTGSWGTGSWAAGSSGAGVAGVSGVAGSGVAGSGVAGSGVAGSGVAGSGVAFCWGFAGCAGCTPESDGACWSWAGSMACCGSSTTSALSVLEPPPSSEGRVPVLVPSAVVEDAGHLLHTLQERLLPEASSTPVTVPIPIRNAITAGTNAALSM